jgi:hypothetical protein
LIALVLVMAGVPPLAFSLGMYLPISINFAVLVGAVTSWLVGKSSKNEKVCAARKAQGTLIASGMMAGAAIFGIVAAVFRIDWNEMFGTDFDVLAYPVRYISIGVPYVVKQTAAGASFLTEFDSGDAVSFYNGFGGQFLGLMMYVLLALVCFALARWGAAKDMEERGERP